MFQYDLRESLFKILKEKEWEKFVYLIENGADLSLKNKEGLTLLEDVCRYSLYTDIMLPVKGHYKPIIDFLLEHGADANNETPSGYTPIYLYVKGACVFPIPKQLIQKTSVENLNKIYGDLSECGEDYPKGETLLTSLNLTHYLEDDIINLVGAGADINKPDNYGNTILGNFCHKPCYEGREKEHLSYLKTLLSLGAKLTQKESLNFADYVLYLGSNRLEAKVFVELLKANAIDLSVKTEIGNTLLHTYATHFDRRVPYKKVDYAIRNIILQKLLEKIDVNAQNNLGETPLNAAVKVLPESLYRDYEEVPFYGGYIRKLNYRTRSEQIKELLHANANPHIPDKNGFTPYHNAFETKQPHYAFLLEEHDKTVKNDKVIKHPLTPLEQAIENYNQNCRGR